MFRNKSPRKRNKPFRKKIDLKSQIRCRSEKQNVFIEEVNKIALSASNDKRIQSIDSKEEYAIIHKKEEIKCNNKIKRYEND